MSILNETFQGAAQLATELWVALLIEMLECSPVSLVLGVTGHDLKNGNIDGRQAHGCGFGVGETEAHDFHINFFWFLTKFILNFECLDQLLEVHLLSFCTCCRL